MKSMVIIAVVLIIVSIVCISISYALDNGFIASTLLSGLGSATLTTGCILIIIVILLKNQKTSKCIEHMGRTG